MSQLLVLLLGFGLTAGMLRDLVRGVAERSLDESEALRLLRLGPRRLERIRRLVLVEPDCVERAALELGIDLDELDRAKWAILFPENGSGAPKRPA